MRILILFITLCLPGWLFSQHNHFIYIQGENQQLFYVKRSGELLSSSATGFLILPKLQPGTHQFVIGFPRDQFPEYEFQVEINGKDRGFTLKNIQEKGWGLLDMQSQELIPGKRIEKQKEQEKIYGEMSDDPFAVILASVVNDPGIRETSLVHSAAMVSAPVNKPVEKPVAMKENKPADKTVAKVQAPPVVKAEEKNIPTKTDQSVASSVPPQTVVPDAQQKAVPVEPPKVDNKPDMLAGVEKKQPAPPVTEPVVKKADEAANEKYAPRRIEKISELKTWSGYQITFIDNSGPRPDTINVIIDDGEVTGASETVKAEEPAAPKVKMPRTDCKNMAREKDVLSLRKKMLTLATDTEMVDAVLKEAKVKCFTVEQLQNLSYVFVNDAGRYMLFEQAYPYILDPANYHRLGTQLTGDDYLERFRNLIR